MAVPNLETSLLFFISLREAPTVRNGVNSETTVVMIEKKEEEDNSQDGA